VLNGVLLPAVMLVPANAALAYEAWDALRLFPYQRRFRFYHALQASPSCKFCSVVGLQADNMLRFGSCPWMSGCRACVRWCVVEPLAVRLIVTTVERKYDAILHAELCAHWVCRRRRRPRRRRC